MKMKILVVLIAVILLTGCSTYQNQSLVVMSGNLTSFTSDGTLTTYTFLDKTGGASSFQVEGLFPLIRGERYIFSLRPGKTAYQVISISEDRPPQLYSYSTAMGNLR